MSDAPENVVAIPVWKQGATAEERFLELAQLAREEPERFKKVVVCWWGHRTNGRQADSYISVGCNVFEVLGMLTIARRRAEDWNLET